MLKGLILDMDGVLWHDKEPIGNLAEIFAQIQKLGLDFVLATNNSSKTVEEFQKKIDNFGIVDGRIYLRTLNTLYCLGTKG